MSTQPKARITVDIYGQQYSIVGTESARQIRDVANLVDSKMKEIASRNPYLDATKLAVLTAVNVMNEYMKLKETYEELVMELNEKEGRTKE